MDSLLLEMSSLIDSGIVLQEIKNNLGQADSSYKVSVATAAERGIDFLKHNLFDDSKEWLDVISDWIWEQLHCGHWKDVPLPYRRLYALSSLLQGYLCIKNERYKDALLTIDKGLLLGAPVMNEYLTKVATALSMEQKISRSFECATKCVDGNEYQVSSSETAVKSRVHFRNYQPNCYYPAVKKSKGESNVKTVDCPPLVVFAKEYMRTETPVILSNCINHWPAMRLWRYIYYFYSRVGEISGL